MDIKNKDNYEREIKIHLSNLFKYILSEETKNRNNEFIKYSEALSISGVVSNNVLFFTKMSAFTKETREYWDSLNNEDKLSFIKNEYNNFVRSAYGQDEK